MLKHHTSDSAGLLLTKPNCSSVRFYPQIVIKQKLALVKDKMHDFASFSLQCLSPFSDVKILPKDNHKAMLKKHRNM